MKIQFERHTEKLRREARKLVEHWAVTMDRRIVGGMGSLYAVRSDEAQAVLADAKADAPILDDECARSGKDRHTAACEVMAQAEDMRKQRRDLVIRMQRVLADINEASPLRLRRIMRELEEEAPRHAR